MNDEEVIIHWYDTSTNKMFRGRYGNFYPGWSDEDAVVQHVKAQRPVHQRQARSTPQPLSVFPKLTVRYSQQYLQI